MDNLFPEPLKMPTVRQRALLKAALFILAAFLFVMLACNPGPPPPEFSVTVLEGPLALLPGDQAEYHLTVKHVREVGPLAGAKIAINSFLLPEHGGRKRIRLNLPSEVTTDRQGELKLRIKIPDEATSSERIQLQFDLKDHVRRGHTSLVVGILPEISLNPLNEESNWGAGPITDVLFQIVDNRAGEPLVNAAWRTNIHDGPDGMAVTESGMTDENGIARVRINNKGGSTQDLYYGLNLIVESPKGEFETYVEGSKGVEAFDVLISTDKPVYQPGQTVHARGLALFKTNMRAADAQTFRLSLLDPKGTVVAKKTALTSSYGVATADFPLDDQIASGDYTLRAETDFGIYKRTIEIKPYSLPRFEIAFAVDQPFYTSGSIATGTINATYFFGKPVANGAVRITGSAPEAPGSPDRVELFTITGETDESGRFDYQLALPDWLGEQASAEAVTVDLEIGVIDGANHAEETGAQITVSQQPLIFDAVAESGQLHPGVENVVYLQVSTPDGRPAQTFFSVDDGERVHDVESDQFGLASILIYPTKDERVRELTVEAQGLDHLVRQTIQLPIEQAEATTLLLRPEKAELTVGEPLNVEVFVASHQESVDGSDLVLVEVSKQGYRYAAEVAAVVDGRARASLQLDPSLMGTLEVSARLVLQENRAAHPTTRSSSSSSRSESTAADHRLVLVNPSAMEITLAADTTEYRPGDAASLRVHVERNGQPVQGVLGVAVVDESVFALGAQDPAFARTYFLIDKELTRPHYGIRGFAPFGGEPSPYRRAERLAMTEQAQTVAATLRRSQNLALFGALAEELDWVQSVHAVAPVRDAAGEDASHAVPLGIFLAAVVISTGRRHHMQTFVALALIVLTTLIWTACASAPPESVEPVPAPVPYENDSGAGEAFRETGGSIVDEQTAAKPRLRQFFPETLLWLPEIETDENGNAQIDLEVADSITTWRVSVVASDREGNLGSAQLPLRVFQDFFVEPNLPLFLTEGDEIDVPVTVFNYLDEEQTVDLEIGVADWFEVRGETELSVSVSPNDVTAVYIPIRVLDAGSGEFQLTATGSSMSDAVLRSVTVDVNGQLREQIINGVLQGDVSHELLIDERSIAEESKITLRLYPGPLSEMVSGLEAMLREPNGCFEQTSSINYPNVMILDYLRATDQNLPEVERLASGFVERGYQRLLTFEVDNEPGGFSLYGDPPPEQMLTAYGLMQFNDQQKVTYVDPALLKRMTDYLVQHQNEDGSWHAVGRDSGYIAKGDDHETVVPTAYVVWALAEAGAAQASVASGVEYLLDALNNQQIQSNYGLATTANALIAAGYSGDALDSLLTQLAGTALARDGGSLEWSAGRSTYMGGYADAADVETSAMVAIAFLKSRNRLDLAASAIQGLQEKRGAHGYYYSTQATILVLKALTLSEQWRDDQTPVVATVTLNGKEIRTINASAATQTRPLELELNNVNLGTNNLSIAVEGERPLSYQVVAESYLPWTEVVEESADPHSRSDLLLSPELDLTVTYDTTEVDLNETVPVEARMLLHAFFPVSNLMAEIGLPPGFRAATGDLDRLVAETAVADYEIRRDKVILYISEMEPDQEYTFRYRLSAHVPGIVQAPPSFGYPYYASSLRTIDGPQTLVVTAPADGLTATKRDR